MTLEDTISIDGELWEFAGVHDEIEETYSIGTSVDKIRFPHMLNDAKKIVENKKYEKAYERYKSLLNTFMQIDYASHEENLYLFEIYNNAGICLVGMHNTRQARDTFGKAMLYFLGHL